MPDSAPLPLRSWLRRLVAIDIALTVILVLLAFFDTHFLPPFLAEYEVEWEEGPSLIALVLFAAAGLAWLIAVVFSWVALWRGWRCGRRLYTMVWAAGLALVFLDFGPVISSVPGSIVDILVLLNGGLIFSLLYFTELRHFYSRHDLTQPA